eukprot:GGOE01046761.1.p6 GENE.GGOE01046761.1~~GGOE01046761.1.p6  ORF type:complete len:133 (-),score=34.05 GGOE01046761.1:303-701(-)
MCRFHRNAYYYAYFLLVSGTLLNGCGLVLGLPLMGLSVLPMVLYVYCRTRPNEVFNFFFDIQIRALHFPWVLMLLHLMLGSSIKHDLVGCVVGHVYFYSTHLCNRHWYDPPRLFCEWAKKAADALGQVAGTA